MSHVRTQIRKAIETALKTRNEFRGNVYSNRRGALAEDEIPGALIRTPSEVTESMMDERKERTQTITVELIAGKTAAPQEVDDLCVACEAVLDCQSLNDLVVILELQSTEIDFTRDNEIQTGSALLTFIAVLHTRAGDPETSI